MIVDVDMESGYGDENWIYVGGDINIICQSKVGKTTGNLINRHRSPQNPGFFIYAAFQIVLGSVHEIEASLLNHLKLDLGFQPLPHFSTSGTSECFEVNPCHMADLVEDFIGRNFSSCVTYETTLHGGMSRYQCDSDIVRYFENRGQLPQPPPKPEPRTLGRENYFTGNQETYEVDLGGGHYVDVASGLQMHRDDGE